MDILSWRDQTDPGLFYTHDEWISCRFTGVDASTVDIMVILLFQAYDAFIKTTQQELNLELDSPSSGTPSILAHPPAAKPQIRSPRKSDQNRHISRSLRNSVSSLSSPDASPRAGSQKHPIGSVIARQQSDSESSGRWVLLHICQFVVVI